MYRTIIFIILLSASSVLFAQNNKISGVITDAKTNEPLPGAGIVIENTTKGTVSSFNGSFKIEGIKEKKLNLIISFIGYETKSVECDFANQPNIELDVVLNEISQQIDEVNVTAMARGQQKAMLDQKLAENIKNIVSSEQIEQFPDMNAAEVIQRIPGITLQRDQGEGRFVQLRGTPPELTNFNINGEQIPSPEGDVRYVGLDVIAADQIEFVEITKVLTPDMDADGIGGNVNIVTKRALDEKPDISVAISGGYNNLRQKENYQMQFSYGARNGKFGFNINSSYFQNNLGSDNMEFDYIKGPFWGSQDQGVENYKVQYKKMELRHYDITRTRIGISTTMDYTFNEHSVIYLRGMFNSFTDDEIRRRETYETSDAISEVLYRDCSIDHDIRERSKIQEIFSLNLGGRNRVGSIKMDYEAAYAFSREKDPHRLEATFDSPGHGVIMKFDLTDPDWPHVTFPEENEEELVRNYDEYEFDELILENNMITDQNITGKMNFEIPYQNGYFKFGGKVRFKEKQRDDNSKKYGGYPYSKYINPYPGEVQEMTLAGVSDGFRDDNLLDKGYIIEAMPGAQQMRDFYEFNSHLFVYDQTGTRQESFGADYKASEDIYAFYGMFKHNFNKLMLLGGLRFEKTVIDYTGHNVVTEGKKFVRLDTLSDQRSHAFWLPQFQVKYSMNKNSNFRAAVTRTYSRPNFKDVLPYKEEKDNNEFTFGNPNLRYPQALNFDLLGETYFHKNGLLSGGIFYKRIDDFIFYFKRFAHQSDASTGTSLDEITIAANGLDASVYGAEFQFQSKLYFLPAFLKNFGLFANYTYTYSEAFIQKRFPANYSDALVVFGEDDLSVFFDESGEKEKITLPGQAKHSANLALFYESERFYAKITANYHDAFLDELGADSDLDEYYDKAWHFDFTTNYLITDNLNIFIDLINLSNVPLKFYLGTPDKLMKQEYYSWWGRIGVKLNF
ncbi:MAG: TonB-dependent receptor [Bacteroidales bacterium]|nr:TonB-dependent receptor [Bacteroidales bacterium]